MLMNQAQFSRHIKRSRQYVNKLVHKGILEINIDKKLNVEKSIQAIKDYEDPKREAQRVANEERRNGKNLMDVIDETPPLSDEERIERERRYEALRKEAKEAGIEDSKIAEEVTKLSMKELNLKSLELDVKIKQYKADEIERKTISLDEANQKVFVAFRIARDGIFSLSGRLSAILAAESNPHTIRTTLESEFTKEFIKLSEAVNEL